MLIKLITRTELAEQLRRSEKTVRRWECFLAPAILRGGGRGQAVLYDCLLVEKILHERGIAFQGPSPERRKGKNNNPRNQAEPNKTQHRKTDQ
ncbi:MAG TPA: hypothetical protein PK406_14985 [Verrucomicrobiota bacterium]|nr:hypothetical protein [Verrucomicrobiota bacterium]